MIFQFAIATLAVAALATANPLRVYSRKLTNFQQCGSLPTRCLNAYRDYIQAIGSSSSSHQHPSDRVAHATQTWLDAQCSSECLGPYLRCAGITERVRNLTLQISCARAEDGNFCLPKVIREVARGLSIIPPSTCTTCNMQQIHPVPEFSSPTTKWSRMLRRNFVYQQIKPVLSTAASSKKFHCL